jgi:hypothetical protein
MTEFAEITNSRGTWHMLCPTSARFMQPTKDAAMLRLYRSS